MCMKASRRCTCTPLVGHNFPKSKYARENCETYWYSGTGLALSCMLQHPAPLQYVLLLQPATSCPLIASMLQLLAAESATIANCRRFCGARRVGAESRAKERSLASNGEETTVYKYPVHLLPHLSAWCCYHRDASKDNSNHTNDYTL